MFILAEIIISVSYSSSEFALATPGRCKQMRHHLINIEALVSAIEKKTRSSLTVQSGRRKRIQGLLKCNSKENTFGSFS